MTKIIEVIISPDGSTKIETKGFSGASCRDASRFIEQAWASESMSDSLPSFTRPSPHSKSHKEKPDMSTVRRRVLRPHRAAVTVDPRRQQLIEKRRAQLDRERSTLNRWMSKLKRAFHAVEKGQRRIVSIERRIAQLQQS
jgi:predicted RNase H-like nuclease (RuvC/YqgF family)